MYIVDSHLFRQTLKERGYHSIGELAKALGIHRNTIHYYLSGHAVLPESFEKLIRALRLKPSDILTEETKSLPHEEIAPLVDLLHAAFPEISFILFGSRARSKNHRYSDWDLGVYSKEGIPHATYRRLVRIKEEWVESKPLMVDLVNLNQADDLFIRSLARDWVFLAGKQQDWIDLQKRSLS